MNQELKRLDLYHIRAEISSTGDAGSTRLGIVLSGSQILQPLPRIYAEGTEQIRFGCNALAHLKSHDPEGSNDIDIRLMDAG